MPDDLENPSPPALHNQSRLKRIIRWLWALAKHPITALVAAIAVGFTTYFLSKSAKSPVFAVSPPELVAQKVNGEGNLKIFWEDKEISNVASVKIALWNEGSQYIDKNDVSTSDPIRIKSAAKVKILSVNQVASSRDTLKFNWQKDVDANGSESAVISVVGDEALERLDGALFHVLFSGQLDSPWAVTGRIKGAPSGFQQKKWSRVRAPEPKERWAYASVFLLAVLVLSAYLIYGWRSKKLTGKAAIDWGMVGPLGVQVLLFGALAIYQYYGYLFAPTWLNR